MGCPTWHKRVTRGRLDTVRMGPALPIAAQQRTPFRRSQEITPTTSWFTGKLASNLSPEHPPPITVQSSTEVFDTVGLQPFPNLFRGLDPQEVPREFKQR